MIESCHPPQEGKNVNRGKFAFIGRFFENLRANFRSAMDEREQLFNIPTEEYEAQKEIIRELLNDIIYENTKSRFDGLYERFDPVGASMSFDGIDHDKLRAIIPSLKSWIDEEVSKSVQSSNPTGPGPVSRTLGDLRDLLDAIELELMPIEEELMM